MPIDSTADLLFRIGANSDDAESNISRFRSLLSKDLGDIGGEFSDWSEKILGNISTVQGAAVAGGAVLAAAVVAVGAAANEAANHYAEYVSEVARGSKTTGISIEAMSGLKLAAEETGTSYDLLVTGLTRFGSTVVKAAEGGKQQQEMFQRLGISQEQVAAGEKDMLPLLMTVADRFKGMGSQVDRAAMARELFSRGGAELVNMLSQGSEGLKQFAEKARELGLVLTNDDVVAMREYKAALVAIKDQHEALEVTVGRTMLPMKTSWEILDAAIVKTLFSMATWKDFLANIGNPGVAFTELLTRMTMNADALAGEIQKVAHSLGVLGHDTLGDAGKAVKEAATDFRGFSDILSEIKTKTADTQGEESKLVDQVRRLQDSLSKAGDEYRKLRAEGKGDGDGDARECGVPGGGAATPGDDRSADGAGDREIARSNSVGRRPVAAGAAEAGAADDGGAGGAVGSGDGGAAGEAQEGQGRHSGQPGGAGAVGAGRLGQDFAGSGGWHYKGRGHRGREERGDGRADGGEEEGCFESRDRRDDGDVRERRAVDGRECGEDRGAAEGGAG